MASILSRVLILALLALGAATAADAQVRLAGAVRDDDSGQPIAGALVEIFDFGGFKLAQEVTDTAGGFEYLLRRPGTYGFRVSRIGYRPVRTPPLSTGAHSYVNVEVRLKSDAVLLAPLTVVARTSSPPSPVLDGFHARIRSGFGTFYTREDVERHAPAFLSDLVARIPGMYVASSGNGLQRHIYTGRGGSVHRGCPAQIWVDGFLLNPPGLDDGSGLTLDEAVPPSSVEGMEIYRGLATVPAEFLNENASCGVIAVWTRRGGR